MYIASAVDKITSSPQCDQQLSLPLLPHKTGRSHTYIPVHTQSPNTTLEYTDMLRACLVSYLAAFFSPRLIKKKTKKKTS